MTSREELIAAAQALAAKKGTSRLGCGEFIRATRFTTHHVYRHFRNWGDLCAEAGLESSAVNTRIDDQAVFRAMRDAFLACGGIVTREEFLRQFRYSAAVIGRRFRNWRDALVEFAAWAREHAPDFPHHDALAAHIAHMAALSRSGPPAGPPWPSHGSRACGEALGFRGLAHAPVNEFGVIFLFATVADDLGYSVETVAAEFPDCMAKRRVAGDRWENVRIEFEFRSRSFRAHRHPEDGCDVIVCWEHDWADCPLEVLELKSAITGMRMG